ncbi:hypothetical protein [Paraburkholderia rhizosphaerae]|uniref:hypothetical protein n=1 Tax=Paraburkholderia rhizosphaerae TaxID=480658 RepID=UPI001065C243|nr:hypothetical protein [Paraburkholderia rhizosphaerae]
MMPSVKSLKGKAEIAGTSIEGAIELSDDKKLAAANTALQLDEMLGRLARRKPVLLLVDEAQSLGRSEEGEDVARALRTALTKHKDKLRVVFTGSSRTQLGHVFTDTRAPLYSAANPLQDFPLLDDAFVQFVAARFAAATSRKLNLQKAKAAFARFHCRPEPLLEVAITLMMQPRMSFDAAVALQLDKLAGAEGHETTWDSLSALERLLVREIAGNPAFRPFSRDKLNALKEKLGVGALGATQVQRALARLAGKNIVLKSPREAYEFENENFGIWVRNMAEAP